MITTVFLKSTVRPCPSVILPSSSIWSKTLNTSGCAFSTSSSRITQYGCRRTASVSCPPSSYPTYPGGAPINRETVCFSMYSLISIRAMAFASSKRNSASDLARCVLPTPVGPMKRKEPSGRSGSPRPTRARRIALETALTASSCPITCSRRRSSMLMSFCVSPSMSR